MQSCKLQHSYLFFVSAVRLSRNKWNWVCVCVCVFEWSEQVMGFFLSLYLMHIAIQFPSFAIIDVNVINTLKWNRNTHPAKLINYNCFNKWNQFDRLFSISTRLSSFTCINRAQLICTQMSMHMEQDIKSIANKRKMRFNYFAIISV